MTTEKFKVLVVDQGRGVWGAQRYLLRLAPLLVERGLELTLAGPTELEFHQVWREAGFAATPLEIPVDRSIRDASGRPTVRRTAREAMAVPRGARMMAEAVVAGGHDAIWANSHWTHLDAAAAGRMCRVPTVLHLHEEALPGLGTWLRTGAVRVAQRTVAVSQAVAAGLPSWVARRIEVIPNGVDTEEMSDRGPAAVHEVRADLGVDPDDLVVLAATRIDPCKRIEDLVTSVLAIEDPRVRLVVAGTTSAFPEYQDAVIADARRRGGARVTFCGARTDMVDLFRASDVFLHAGMVEGMPLGVLEAQSCGVPVVAYAVAGVPEVVRDGVTGHLARPGAVDDLARALQLVVANPEARQRMGAAAREDAVARHDIRLQARRNADLLLTMCRDVRAAVPA